MICKSYFVKHIKRFELRMDCLFVRSVTHFSGLQGDRWVNQLEKFHGTDRAVLARQIWQHKYVYIK